MFLIIINVTFFILLAVLILGFCATRSQSEIVRKEDKSEKSSPWNSSPSRSKRARPLEPEGLIPAAEGSVKNPDVGEMISERSRKSQRSMERSQKMKGFVLEKDRSVRRLEDRSKYEAKTSARYKRSAVGEMNDGSLKTAKSPKKSKKSAKEKSKGKKSQKSKSKSSKKEKKGEKMKLESKKSEKKLDIEE